MFTIELVVICIWLEYCLSGKTFSEDKIQRCKVIVGEKPKPNKNKQFSKIS
jgi:hypothetical protein